MSEPAARDRWIRLACLALPLAAPALGTCALMAYYGYSLANYRPGIPNDETLAFLQVRAFAAHGFNAGYFGVEEHVAPASFSHFGVHGPVFAVIYGAFGRLFGTSYGLATYLNVAALTLALAVYVWVCRPSNGALVLLALFVLTFWPFYFFVFSWVQDALQYAFAVLLAGPFAALLGDPPPGRRRVLFWSTLAAVCVASSIRVSWASLLLPLFLLIRRHGSARSLVVAAGLGCATTVACMKAFQLLCAPYPSEPGAFLMNKLFTGGVSPDDYRRHVWNNLRGLAMYFRTNLPLGREIVGQSLLFLVALGVVAVYYAYSRRSARTGKEPLAVAGPAAGRWLAFLAYNLGAIAVATVLLYWVENFGAARIFSVHLLLGLLVAFNAPLRSLRFFLAAALLCNLVTAPRSLEAIDTYDALRFDMPGGHVFARQRVAAFQEAAARVMPFDPKAGPWGNTLLTDRLPMELDGLPPGIGVEYYFSPQMLSRPVRSRYIIAVPEEISRLGTKVTKIATLPRLGSHLYKHPGSDHADLYLNLSPADPPGPTPGGEHRP